MTLRSPFVAYLFSLLLIAGYPLRAQVIFNAVLPPEGSSWGGTINAITQDKQGYMYFASFVGLHRYDGYHLISYKHDPANSNSLISNQVRYVYSDRKGYLWIGTTEGLDKFDPATGFFIHFRHRSYPFNSLSDNDVRIITEDHEGNMWIGTDEGVDRMDTKTGRFTHYRHDAANTASLSDGRVMAIYEDKQGTLWIGTAKGASSDGPFYGGLNRFNKNNGTFTHYQHEPGNPHSLLDDRVTAIFEDSQGHFWVGTSGYALHNMDREKGSFERYMYNPGHTQLLNLPAAVHKNYMYEYPTFITEDAKGALWVGTFQKGLSRYDPAADRTTHYEADSVSGFTDRSGWRAYTSREGVLWISTIEGELYRVDPLRKTIPYFPTGFPVDAIYQDTSGAVWMGNSQGGLIRTDRTKKITKRFYADTIHATSLSNNFPETIYQDRQGILWIGTQDGLNQFNRKTETFTRYTHNPLDSGSITQGHTHAMYEDRNGSLWIGTQQGLNLFNRQTVKFTHYINNVNDSSSLSNNSIVSITDDHLGRLWVGTEGGINRLDISTRKFKRYLYGSATISSIVEDAAGIIWAASASGLYRFNKVADSFILFTNPGSGISAVAHLLEDRNGNLWGTTTGAIFKLDKARSAVSIYGKNNGVDSRNTSNSACKGALGEFFFGYASGYYAFSPDQYLQNSSPPQIIIADFRLADKIVQPGKNSPLPAPLSQVKKISLHFNQNVFSFDFVGVHYSSPEENRLYFMMENLDNTWHKAGSEKTAYYYNVPPGHYIFRVKAANSDGVWAEKSIAVIVNPPWWQRWWAYGIYAFLTAATIWFFVDYRSRSLRSKNKLLEENVVSRTAELKQQKDELQNTLTELKATQSQLVQREKMASLGELTAGIAHEIQNPLNFVNNFSEVSDELLQELRDEIEKPVLDKEYAKGIISDLSNNLRKISHHGKRADAIVKGMLQHSRSNTGQKEPTDINALADEYMRLSYHGLRAKDKSFNATLKINLDETIGMVDIVPQDMGRVLLNLFNNAFYAVTQKKQQSNSLYEPTVSVMTKKLDDKIEISVRDNGNGIPQKIVDKVFQPFFTTKPSGEGTGLGLSLSYDIVKAHGGEIQVNTSEGAYTEFIILLPTGKNK